MPWARAGRAELPDGLVVDDEIALRTARLARLAEAKAVLESRAKERYAAERAEYEAKVREREERAAKSSRKPGGRPPQAPIEEPPDKDQYNFTDPDSRIMKRATKGGASTRTTMPRWRSIGRAC